jgi:hypothetical protein
MSSQAPRFITSYACEIAQRLQGRHRCRYLSERDYHMLCFTIMLLYTLQS